MPGEQLTTAASTNTTLTTSSAIVESSLSSCGPLKPSFLAKPGEPPIKWEMWLRLFDDHLFAHNLDGVADKREAGDFSEQARCGRFSNLRGPEPRSWHLIRQNRSQDTKRFATGPSRILARAQCNRRMQQSGEDCAIFATALLARASKCGYFVAIVTELVLDRVVVGCWDEKIRQRFLHKLDTVTLERSLGFASTLERALAKTKTVTESSTPVVDQIGYRVGNKNLQTSRNQNSSTRH